jgi:hypothetical protein
MPKVSKYLIGGVLVVVAVGAGLHWNIIRLPVRIKMEGLYATNFADNEKLVGASHNVFVGKVIKQVGDKELARVPATQFSVHVILNIKGNLQGTAVVEQEIGYRNGILYTTEDGGTLLQPGATYLFAARYNSSDNWYTLIAGPYGKSLISQDSSLNDAQLTMAATANSRVVALREAYPNEKLLDVDVYHKYTKNSYQSRRVDANGQVIDDTMAPASPEPTTSVAPSLEPGNSPESSVAPSDASAGDMASPMPSDMPLAS